MEFVERIKAKAAEEIKTIVLPEAAEERNIKAANQIIKEGFAKLVLIGNPDQIHHLASETAGYLSAGNGGCRYFHGNVKYCQSKYWW